MATPGSGRRLRRSRESQASNDEGGAAVAAGAESSASLSGYDLYNIQGDSRAALSIFCDDDSNTASMASEYNCFVLSQLISNKRPEKTDFLQKMQDIESRYLGQQVKFSARKRRRNEFILAYNKALVLHASGENEKCIQICVAKIRDLVESKQLPSEDLSEAASRMALLVLECVLVLSIGTNVSKTCERLRIPGARTFVAWLELLDTEKDAPQLKFNLNLYKSRLDLKELDERGKHVEAKVRSSRKELKQAMEVFQHKLRPSFGAESGSVASSANSEENSTIHEGQHTQQQQPSSVVLQKYNQCALNLKANLEQLKGNTKKALVLCGEALVACSKDSMYEAVNSNNLAVIYETNKKRHLALHALSKSLQTSSDTQMFRSDGIACPDQILFVLYNTAICALQAKNFISAYECMSTCVARSQSFRDHPRCWLRMAEACIGHYDKLRTENGKKKFSTLESNGEAAGIFIEDAMISDNADPFEEDLVRDLSSPEDLEQVRRNPLVRARASLEFAMIHLESFLGPDEIYSAKLMMSFVHIAFHDWLSALSFAEDVLNSVKDDLKRETDLVVASAKRRYRATACMYAAEAKLGLGDPVGAMTFLVGDGQDDAFDRLASDLSGVTIEMAATNVEGKRRLARAQASVRSSACVVIAAMGGNSSAAKKLAMSAQSMEDAGASSRVASYARRALIYALLREGQQSPVWSLLLSLR